MAPSWRLLAKFGEVELPGPLFKTDKCPCGFCWCGKFGAERSPMSIFRTFISTEARESLKELLDGDGLNGDFGGCVPASTLNANANQDLSGHHAGTSVIRHSSAASEETRKTLESSAQREESLQASALDSEAASTGKTVEEDEDACSSSKSRSRSSEINSQTSLAEGENSNSSSSNSDSNSQLSTSSTSDDQSSSSLLSDLTGHETLNFTRQNNTLDSTCNFCFRREEKKMQSTLLCVPNTRSAAKSECDHCKRASVRSSVADSNLSTSESAESQTGNRWSRMSQKADEFQSDIQNNSLVAQSDISLIDQEPFQNTLSNASIESKIGKNRVSAGGEPSINHIKTATPAELEYSQTDEDQEESLSMDMYISFEDQNQVDQGVRVAEISQFSSASSETPKQEDSSGSQTPVVNSDGCQTADKSIGRIDLPNIVVEASGNPVSLTDDSQDADNDELCDEDVDDSANLEPTPSPKYKRRKSLRLLQKSSSEVAGESSESSDEDDNPDDPAYTKSGSETEDSEETTDDGGDSDDDDNAVAASSRDLSVIQEEKKSDADKQTGSKSVQLSRQQNVRKKAPNAKHRRRKFYCHECGEGFEEKKELNLHLREHDSVQPFKCGFCADRFETRKKYLIHYKSHKDQTGRYHCNQCEYSTQYSSSINRHLRVHSGERLYTCDDCGKAFSTRVHLTDHKRVHSGERPYKCGQCSQSFAVKITLTNHLRLHSGERPYECDDCGKAFNQLGILTTHQRIHSDERPYECDECAESFKQAQQLKSHKRIHSGERPYKCDVCKKTFKYSNVLKDHKQIHSGERPYKCDQCNKSFSDPSNLRKHKRVHSGETPYQCPKCAKCFTHKSSLQRHQKLMHRKKKPNQHSSSQ